MPNPFIDEPLPSAQADVSGRVSPADTPQQDINPFMDPAGGGYGGENPFLAEPEVTDRLGGMLEAGETLFKGATIGVAKALVDAGESQFGEYDAGGMMDTVQKYLNSSVEERYDEAIAEGTIDDKTGILGMTKGEMIGFQDSIGFSLLNMFAAKAGQVAGAVTPVPGGSVAGGLGASGYTAFHASRGSMTDTLRDEIKAVYQENFGEEIPEKDFEAAMANPELEKMLNEYAAWEAGPEAVGSLIGANLFFGRGMKLFGKEVAADTNGAILKYLGRGALGQTASGIARGMAAFALNLPVELATETVTEIGQSQALEGSVVGPEEGEAMSFAEPLDWVKAGIQVAPETFLLSTIIGGGGGISSAVRLNRKISESRKYADEANKILDDAGGYDNLSDTQKRRFVSQVKQAIMYDPVSYEGLLEGDARKRVERLLGREKVLQQAKADPERRFTGAMEQELQLVRDEAAKVYHDVLQKQEVTKTKPDEQEATLYRENALEQVLEEAGFYDRQEEALKKLDMTEKELRDLAAEPAVAWEKLGMAREDFMQLSQEEQSQRVTDAGITNEDLQTPLQKALAAADLTTDDFVSEELKTKAMENFESVFARTSSITGQDMFFAKPEDAVEYDMLLAQARGGTQRWSQEQHNRFKELQQKGKRNTEMVESARAINEHLNMEIVNETGETVKQFDYVPATPNTVASNVGRRVAKAFGKKVYFFRGSNTASFPINGNAPDSNSDIIFINADLSAEMSSATVGHEIAHQLYRDQNELFREFYDYAVANLDPAMFRKYNQRFTETRGGVRDDRLAQNELIADFIGTRFVEPAFMDKVAEENPSMLQRVADFVREVIAPPRQQLNTREYQLYFRDFDDLVFRADNTLARIAGNTSRKALALSADQEAAMGNIIKNVYDKIDSGEIGEDGYYDVGFSLVQSLSALVSPFVQSAGDTKRLRVGKAVIIVKAHNVIAIEDVDGNSHDLTFDKVSGTVKLGAPEGMYEDPIVTNMADYGLFSALNSAVSQAPENGMKKGGWKQFFKKAMSQGLTQTEMDFTGIERWMDTFAKEDRITREMVTDYLRRNVVQVKVKELRGSENKWTSSQMENINGTRSEEGTFLIILHRPKFDALADVRAREQELTRMLEQIEEGNIDELTDEETVAIYDNLAERQAVLDQAQQSQNVQPADVEQFRGVQSHYSEKDIIVHTRFNTREVNGQRHLFIEEIQSDWSAEGKKKGWKGEPGAKSTAPPKGPFVQDASWQNIAVTALIAHAAANNFDAITLINEYQTQQRWSGMGGTWQFVNVEQAGFDNNNNAKFTVNGQGRQANGETIEFRDEDLTLEEIESQIDPEVAASIEEFYSKEENEGMAREFDNVELEKLPRRWVRALYGQKGSFANILRKRMGIKKGRSKLGVTESSLSLGFRPDSSYAVRVWFDTEQEMIDYRQEASANNFIEASSVRQHKGRWYIDMWTPDATNNLSWTLSAELKERAQEGWSLFSREQDTAETEDVAGQGQMIRPVYARPFETRREVPFTAIQVGEQLIESITAPTFSRSGRILANGIQTTFKEQGGLSLLGERITNPADLAVLAQIYRNPMFETLRYVLVKGDTIVGVNAVTSRLPGVNAPFVGDNSIDSAARYLSMLDYQMSLTGADGYWMMHNHPIGGAHPSGDQMGGDVGATGQMIRTFPGFKGHVVIDYNEFGFILPFEENGSVRLLVDKMPYDFDSNPTDPLAQPSVVHPFLGRRMQSLESLVWLHKDLQLVDSMFSMVSIGVDDKLTGIMEAPMSLFGDPKRLEATIRTYGRKTGSMGGHMFMILPQQHQAMIMDPVIQKLIKGEFVNDVVTETGMVGSQLVQLRGGDIQTTEGVKFGQEITGRVAHPPALLRPATFSRGYQVKVTPQIEIAPNGKMATYSMTFWNDTARKAVMDHLKQHPNIAVIRLEIISQLEPTALIYESKNTSRVEIMGGAALAEFAMQVKKSKRLKSGGTFSRADFSPEDLKQLKLLRAAVRDQGLNIIYPAPVGMGHTDALMLHPEVRHLPTFGKKIERIDELLTDNIDRDEDHGFLDPDDNWLDRGEAMDWLQENDPHTYRGLPASLKQSRYLESYSYWDALGLPQDKPGTFSRGSWVDIGIGVGTKLKSGVNYFSDVATQLKSAAGRVNWSHTQFVKMLDKALRLLPMSSKVDIYTDMFTYDEDHPRFAGQSMLERLQDYIRKASFLQNKAPGEADLKYKEWERLTKGNQKLRDAYEEVMYWATYFGLHPNYDNVERQPWSQEDWIDPKFNGGQSMETLTGMSLDTAHNRLRDMWAKLTPELQDHYLDVTAHMKKMRESVINSIVSKIWNNPGMTEAKRTDMIKQIKKNFGDVRGPYAPLIRYGKYVLIVRDAATDTLEAYNHFESLEELQQAAEAERERNPENDVTVSYKGDVQGDQAGIQLQYIEQLNSLISEVLDAEYEKVKSTDPATAAAQKEQYQKLLAAIVEQNHRLAIKTSPENAAMKHSLKRSRVRKTTDPAAALVGKGSMRAYVTYMQKQARLLSALQYNDAIDLTLRDIKNEAARYEQESSDAENDRTALTARMVATDLERHINIFRKEKTNPVAQQLGKMSLIWYLSSPSQYLVNFSQVFVVTFPKLATSLFGGQQVGAIKAAAAIRKSMGQLAKLKGGRYNNERIEDLERLIAESGIEDKITWEDWQRNREAYEANGQTVGDFKHMPGTRRRFFSGQEAFNGITLNEEQQRQLMLLRAWQNGTLDLTLSHDALDISMGRDRSGLLYKMSWAMRESEMHSRKVALMASYDLARESGMDFDDAFKFAQDTAMATLFDYSKENRPELLSGSTARVLTQFQTFRINMVYRMARLMYLSVRGQSRTEKAAAAKEFAGIMTMVGILGGVFALPFVKSMFTAMDIAFGDDDDPIDTKMLAEQWIMENFGSTVGRALTQGMPSLFGANISRRVGLESVMPFESMAMDVPEWMGPTSSAHWFMAQLMGPSYGIFTDAITGAQLIERGQWIEGAMKMTPKPVRDGLKAYNLATEGLKDTQGRRLMSDEEIGLFDLMFMIAGINPDGISQVLEANRNLATINTRISTRRGTLQRQFTEAYNRGDQDAVDETLEEIIAWNKAQPEFAVTTGDLRSPILKAIKGDMAILGERDYLVTKKFGLPIYSPHQR